MFKMIKITEIGMRFFWYTKRREEKGDLTPFPNLSIFYEILALLVLLGMMACLLSYTYVAFSSGDKSTGWRMTTPRILIL